MNGFIPFANDAGSTSIGRPTIEDGTDRIVLYGSLDLTRDQQGLAHGQVLRTIIDQTVQVLEAQGDLSETPPVGTMPRTIANRFG